MKSFIGGCDNATMNMFVCIAMVIIIVMLGYFLWKRDENYGEKKIIGYVVPEDLQNSLLSNTDARKLASNVVSNV